MKKPNKIYTLTVVYNEESEEVEYLQETIQVDNIETISKPSILVDLSDYWDEDTIKLLKDHYYLAEA
jgi:hypothetical protein|tara:strand:+ start:7545 stop:7745 length:201 start_codon:yes stop_codon:yes gene_type:complete